MINSDLEISLGNIVRGMLPYIQNSYKSKKERAIYIKVQLKAEYINNVEIKFLHFIFTGNVSVWCAVNKEFIIKHISYDEFKNTSNHDSCWSSDGIRDIFNTYIDMCKSVQKDLPEKEKIAPIDIKTFNFIKDVKFVNISYEKYNDVKYKLTKIEEEK